MARTLILLLVLLGVSLAQQPGLVIGNNPPNVFSTISTTSNCSSIASPAVCGTAASGQSIIAAAATTETVNTTAVTANSEVLITEDQGLGTRLASTCNTQSSLVLGTPHISARSAGVSFTVTIDVAPTTNPLCFSYTVIN